MKDFLQEKFDELGVGGFVLAAIMFGAFIYTAIWLAMPFIELISDLPSLIIFLMLYLPILGFISMPIMMLAGFVGNILGFTAEGIIALYKAYKRL